MRSPCPGSMGPGMSGRPRGVFGHTTRLVSALRGVNWFKPHRPTPAAGTGLVGYNVEDEVNVWTNMAFRGVASECLEQA